MIGHDSGSQPVVFVVDDDKAVREAISSLLRSVTLAVEVFDAADRFLEHPLPDAPSCLILDVRLPGTSGLDLQTELAEKGIQIPIIFTTGHGDIPMTVRAMKGGAVEFLTKPFRDQDILDAVHTAIGRDRKRRENEREIEQLTSDYESLTPREREIMALVTTGLMNKQIAGELGLSEITVKVHRGNVNRKMKAQSLAELVKMAEALGISANT